MPKITDSSDLDPDSAEAVVTGRPKEKTGPDRSAPGPGAVSPPPTESQLRSWVVYLAGEIHTPWRNEIIEMGTEHGLPVEFTYPVLDHPASDYCGVSILGNESEPRWRDNKGAKINAIRTRALIAEADIVVARFDDDRKYRQWNGAFDAGFAAALGKSIIILHTENTTHALKEVDAASLAVASQPSEVVQILCYVTGGKTPHKST